MAGEINFEKYLTGQQALTDAAQSVRGLKKEVVAFTKVIDQDADRIKAGLEKVSQAVRDIKASGGSLNLSSESDRVALRELIKEVNRLKTEQAGLKQAGADVATTQRNLKESTSLFTKELKEQREALRKAYDAGNLEGIKKAGAQIQALKQDATALTKALNGTRSEFTAAKGSYDAADASLQKLRAELRALEGGLDGTNPRAAELTAQIQKLDTQLKASDKSMGQAYRNVGNYTQSILDAVRILEQEKTALTAASGALRAQATATGLSAEQQDKLQQELQQTDEALDKVNAELKGYGVAVDDGAKKSETFGGNLKKYVLTLALATFSFEALGAAAQSVFRSNVEYSDAIADVRKTTGLAADESDRLADSLKKIDTRTSLAGLLDIAKVGGQLGIAKEDILDFTKAVDVSVQALGDDYAGGAEQIATELGKIAGVFRKELGPDVAQNLLAIGSAVNEIGAEGAATAPFLSDVALRVGAVSAQTGVGLNNVLAYAAVLEETGFSSERAGTALNRLFSTLSTKTEESFRIAQKANPALTLKEFTRLVNTDFNQAIQLFLKGLNAGGKSTTQQSELLKTLKLQSGEAKNVIITLAQNTDLFAKRQATANEQLREATSLAEEAKIKNDNLAGSTEKLTKQYTSFFTGGTGSRFLKFFVDLNRELGIMRLASDALEDLGNIASAVGQKIGVVKKEQIDYAAETAKTTNALLKQVSGQQKLLDSYTSLGAVVDKTGGQQLEYARLAAKLQAEFGTKEAKAIQASIDLRQLQADQGRQGLQSELSYYDKEFLPGLSQRAAKAQQAVNSINLSPADLERYRKIAQARLDGARAGVVVDGRSLVDDKKIAVLQEQIEIEQRLAKEQQRRAQIAAALGKIEVKSIKDVTDALPDPDDDDAGGVFNKAAQRRAEARRQDLENQLAAQLRLIEETKKLQDEQGRQFEAKAINEEVYAASVVKAQDTIIDAERNAGQIRINLAKAGRDVAIAQADEELNAVKRKKDVSNEEVADATRAHFFQLKGLSLKYKAERLKIEQDLQDKLVEYAKGIDIRPPLIDPDALAKAEKDLDLSNERGLQRMQQRSEKEKAEYQKRIDAQLLAEEQKTARILYGLDLINQAQQALFDLGAERNAAAIDREMEKRDAELKAAGDNEDLKVKIQEESDAKIAALKLKQAKADRAAALFNIALNTAAAVTSVLRTGGGTFYADFGLSAGILSGIVIAQGLAQAALVLSKPLPGYFKGREGGKAEFAQVAEQGPELIEGKSGGMRLVTKPSITYLNEGDKVYTAHKTQVLLQAAERGDVGMQPVAQSFTLASQQMRQPQVDTSAVQAAALATEASADKIVQAIKNMPRTGIIATKYGFEEVIEQTGHMTRLRNKRLGL